MLISSISRNLLPQSLSGKSLDQSGNSSSTLSLEQPASKSTSNGVSKPLRAPQKFFKKSFQTSTDTVYKYIRDTSRKEKSKAVEKRTEHDVSSGDSTRQSFDVDETATMASSIKQNLVLVNTQPRMVLNSVACSSQMFNIDSTSPSNGLSMQISNQNTVNTTPGTSLDNVASSTTQMVDQPNQDDNNFFDAVSKMTVNPPAYEKQLYNDNLPTYQVLSEQKQIDAYKHNLFFQNAEEAERRIDSNIVKSAHLPSYCPTNYKLSVAMVKFEKNQILDILNDSNVFYEVSNNCKWQLMLVELNSTQINLYHLDLNDFLYKELNFSSEEAFTDQIRADKDAFYNDHQFRQTFYDHTFPSFQKVDMFDAINFDNGVLPLGAGSQYCAHYNRYYGNNEKLKLKQTLERGAKKSGFFKNLGMSSSTADLGYLRKRSNSSVHNTNLNTYSILTKVIKDPFRYLSESKMIKSLSLQYGKIGLANDFVFLKKEHLILAAIYGNQHCPNAEVITHNVLRLRLEVYQLLIDFKYLNELINWYNYIINGIDVALDLQVRDMPKFNNVPSRRRRRRRRHKNKKSQRARMFRSRASSTANEFLSRSRRNTVNSTSLQQNSETTSRNHRRRSSLFSNSDAGSLVHESLGANSGVDDRFPLLSRIRTKNSPILNYFMSEFEPKQPKTSSFSSFVKKRSNSNASLTLFRSLTGTSSGSKGKQKVDDSLSVPPPVNKRNTEPNMTTTTSNSIPTKKSNLSKKLFKSETDKEARTVSYGINTAFQGNSVANSNLRASEDSKDFTGKISEDSKNSSGKSSEESKSKTSIPIQIPYTRNLEYTVHGAISPAKSPSSPVAKAAAVLGNSRERSNSLNKLSMARSNSFSPTSQLYQYSPLIPQLSPRVSKGRDRSNSVGSKFTIDSNNNGFQTGSNINQYDGQLSKVLSDFKLRADSAVSITSGSNSPVLSNGNVSPTRSEVSFEKMFGLIDKKSMVDLENYELNNPLFSNLTDVLGHDFNLTAGESEITDEGKRIREQLDNQDSSDNRDSSDNHEFTATSNESDFDEEKDDEDEFDEDDTVEVLEDEYLYPEEDEDDEDDDEEEFHFHYGFGLASGINHAGIVRSENIDIKWNPEDKNPTIRRIVKDSLKSMSVLKGTDSWINNKVIRESVIPNLYYSNNGHVTIKQYRSSKSGELKTKTLPDRKAKVSAKVKYFKYYLVGLSGLIQQLG